jgi:hypothetical protein
VIIGSGLLLEIPLPILAERFAEVILVDLYHLPKVARQARQYGNVTLLARDITGLFDRLAPSLAQGALPVPEVILPEAEQAELIVSANCLSQLSGTPLAIVTAQGGFSPDHCIAWERQIIASHRPPSPPGPPKAAPSACCAMTNASGPLPKTRPLSKPPRSSPTSPSHPAKTYATGGGPSPPPQKKAAAGLSATT